MENLTPGVIFAAVLALASAILLIAQAVEKIIHAVKSARAPNLKQNERLDALEAWRAEVDRKLMNDNVHLANIDSDNRVTQRALLALLDHGIDGNNIQQMQHAKEELQDHLINR
jgi:hypothetical protein